MSYSGKLAVTLSHHHYDHYDIEFIKQCNPYMPIFISKFSENKEEKLPEIKTLKDSLIRDCNMKNIIEIEDGKNHCACFGPFKLYSIRRSVPYVIDSIICIKTNDCFIMHCADCWGFSKDSYEGRTLTDIIPSNIPTMYMGQAGTASGWPLIYYNYTYDEKVKLLNNKTKNMLTNIYNTCKDFNISKALGYAHLSFVQTKLDYFKKYNYTPITGKQANELIDCDLFLDMQPSSIVIPAENFKCINLIQTISNFNCFKDNMIGMEITPLTLLDSEKTQLDEFMNTFRDFGYMQVNNLVITEHDINLTFELIVTKDNTDDIIYNHSITFFSGERLEKLKCTETIITNIVRSIIPFRDLDTGYLAELYREPDFYNNMFYMILYSHAHKFFNFTNDYYD